MNAGSNQNEQTLARIKSISERFAWASASCREARMRLTPVREAILCFLARQRTPATLDMVSQADGVRGQRNPTKVYRTLMMFKEAEVVRLVGTPHKVSYFVLNVPGESNHFLICQRCGQMAELPPLKALSFLDKQVTEKSDYAAVHHDLEVYGICPACRGKSPSDGAKEKGMTLKIGVKTPHFRSAAPHRCRVSP